MYGCGGVIAASLCAVTLSGCGGSGDTPSETYTTEGPSSTPSPGPRLDQTNLTRLLNAQIQKSGPAMKVYTAGKGVLIRSPFDGFEDDLDKTVVPATLWVNDIVAPSQLYPGSGPTDGNPWCPTQHASWQCLEDKDTHDDSPWNYAQLAVVMGTKMSELFTEFDNIQDEDWGWGVFYSSDSNSVDKRCLYLEEYGGYDCPGGWIQWGEDFRPDATKKGAGWYEAGNPNVEGREGGGAGCHFNGGDIDQTNAVDGDDQNLMDGRDCQCNYHFSNDWGAWVDNWRKIGLLSSGGTSASWAMDLAACWMNNPRDMIQLQNQLWEKRAKWNDLTVPEVEYNTADAKANRPYWGWNEIPMSREQVSNINNWDAVVVKLPADACESDNGRHDALSCYDVKYHKAIELSLEAFVNSNYLGLGSDASIRGALLASGANAFPSSSVVLAREYMDEAGDYLREFFCEPWVSPSGTYKIVFEPDGACYLDRGVSVVEV